MAAPGDNLLQVARDAGVYVAASCGGTGVCGTCKVLIKEGTVAADGTMAFSPPMKKRRGSARPARARL